MVEDMDKNLGEVVSFFGLEVQAEMKEFVLTHTDSKCNAQNSYVIIQGLLHEWTEHSNTDLPKSETSRDIKKSF
jgi:hypothetical protein